MVKRAIIKEGITSHLPSSENPALKKSNDICPFIRWSLLICVGGWGVSSEFCVCVFFVTAFNYRPVAVVNGKSSW